MSSNTVKVWDPLVRIFHWSLVACFVIAFLTGDEEISLHVLAGYAVMGLVLFRVFWGFVGSDHARFNDFVFSPGVVLQYLKSLAAGNPRRYLGHNPAGGYMIVVMLLTLMVVTYTGLKAYASEGHGPLAAGNQGAVISVAQAKDEANDKKVTSAEGNESEEYWEEIHEDATYFMLGLIALHIMGFIVSSKLHKENLVKAMINGKKESS